MFMQEFFWNMTADISEDFTSLGKLKILMPGVIPERTEYYSNWCQFVLAMVEICVQTTLFASAHSKNRAILNKGEHLQVADCRQEQLHQVQNGDARVFQVLVRYGYKSVFLVKNRNVFLVVGSRNPKQWKPFTIASWALPQSRVSFGRDSLRRSAPRINRWPKC